ncbi:hypothetical protein KP509_10G027800 [Ceratopteris richardii]|uniref:F-box domain-containing protein n=1 Tax=Ceratopteris richardii TaxID=49495 RepID=A0A8T2TZQ4_CERRI|nr:hypothetical protein KP509_1Z245000 [Ceratopteris richardii]KAH7427043.1 hypothetical protein KP509_10G027800 [Ceratopteris richardii]
METSRPRPDSWAGLPDDLILNVLSRLPLIDILRARCVCSSWNRLASDPSLPRLLASAPPSLPGFALFLSDASSARLLYLDLNVPTHWRSLSLNFLPGGGAGSKLLASSGGLFLLDTAHGELLVVNPVTRSWIQLPPTNAVRHIFYTALSTDAAAGSFTVAAAESELQNDAATEIFQSCTGKWRPCAGPSRAGRWKRVASPITTPWSYGSVPVYCNPVYCRGGFFHLTWDPEEMVSELDVAAGEWRYKKGSGAVPGGVPWAIMQQNDRVLMLEMSYGGGHPGVGSGGAGGGATLSLWELQRDRLSWTSAGRIPPPPRKDYQLHMWQRFAIGEGFVCIIFQVPGTIVTFGSLSEKQGGMIFDSARSKWLSMPDLPGITCRTSCLVSFTASLQPL